MKNDALDEYDKIRYGRIIQYYRRVQMCKYICHVEGKFTAVTSLERCPWPSKRVEKKKKCDVLADGLWRLFRDGGLSNNAIMNCIIKAGYDVD